MALLVSSVSSVSNAGCGRLCKAVWQPTKQSKMTIRKTWYANRFMVNVFIGWFELENLSSLIDMSLVDDRQF